MKGIKKRDKNKEKKTLKTLNPNKQKA